MTNCHDRNRGRIMLTHHNVVWYQSTHGMTLCQYHNMLIIIIIIWFSYHPRRLALHYHQSWSMANDPTLDPYRSISINPSMIDTAIKWIYFLVNHHLLYWITIGASMALFNRGKHMGAKSLFTTAYNSTMHWMIFIRCVSLTVQGRLSMWPKKHTTDIVLVILQILLGICQRQSSKYFRTCMFIINQT